MEKVFIKKNFRISFGSSYKNPLFGVLLYVEKLFPLLLILVPIVLLNLVLYLLKMT